LSLARRQNILGLFIAMNYATDRRARRAALELNAVGFSFAATLSCH